MGTKQLQPFHLISTTKVMWNNIYWFIHQKINTWRGNFHLDVFNILNKMNLLKVKTFYFPRLLSSNDSICSLSLYYHNFLIFIEIFSLYRRRQFSRVLSKLNFTSLPYPLISSFHLGIFQTLKLQNLFSLFDAALRHSFSMICSAQNNK